MYCTVKDLSGHNHNTVKKMVSKHKKEMSLIVRRVLHLMVITTYMLLIAGIIGCKHLSLMVNISYSLEVKDVRMES